MSAIAPVATPPAGFAEMQDLREVRGFREIQRPEPLDRTAEANPDLVASFADALARARTQELESSEAAKRFADGDPGIGIHEVMIASEKTSLAVRYVTTLKNKVVESYRELMNTQV